MGPVWREHHGRWSRCCHLAASFLRWISICTNFTCLPISLFMKINHELYLKVVCSLRQSYLFNLIFKPNFNRMSPPGLSLFLDQGVIIWSQFMALFARSRSSIGPLPSFLNAIWYCKSISPGHTIIFVHHSWLSSSFLTNKRKPKQTCRVFRCSQVNELFLFNIF